MPRTDPASSADTKGAVYATDANGVPAARLAAKPTLAPGIYFVAATVGSDDGKPTAPEPS